MKIGIELFIIDFTKINLLNEYKEELRERFGKIELSKQDLDDFILIKAISYLSDKYSYNKFVRLAYTLIPELVEKSEIKPEIFSVPDEIVRNEIRQKKRTISTIKH